MKAYFLLFCVLCVLYQSGSIFAQSVYNLMPHSPASNSGAPQNSQSSATAPGAGALPHSQWKRIHIETSDVDLYNNRKHCARREDKKEWKWYSRWSNSLRNHEDRDSYCDSCYFNKYAVVFTQEKKKALTDQIIPAIVKHFATKGPLVRHQSAPLDLTYEWNKRSNPCRMFARPQSHDTTPMDNANIMMYVAAMPFTDSSSVWGSRCIVRDGQTVAIALNFNPCYLSFGDEVIKNAISVVSQLLWSSTAQGSDVLALPRQFGLYDYPILAQFNCTRDQKVMVRFEKENVWKHCARNKSYLYGKQFPVSCPKFTDVCATPTDTPTLTVSQSNTLNDPKSLVPKEIKKTTPEKGIDKLTEPLEKAKEKISTHVGDQHTEKQATGPEKPTAEKHVIEQPPTEGLGSEKGTQSAQGETKLSGELPKESKELKADKPAITRTEEDINKKKDTHSEEGKTQLKEEVKKEPEPSGVTEPAIKKTEEDPNREQGTHSKEGEVQLSGDLSKASQELQTYERDDKKKAEEDMSKNQDTLSQQDKARLTEEVKKDTELSGTTGKVIQNTPTVPHDGKPQTPQKDEIKPNEGPQQKPAAPVTTKGSSEHVEPLPAVKKVSPPTTDKERDTGAAHSDDATDLNQGKDVNLKGPVNKVSGIVRDLKNVTFNDSGSIALSTWQFALLSLFIFAMM